MPTPAPQPPKQVQQPPRPSPQPPRQAQPPQQPAPPPKASGTNPAKGADKPQPKNGEPRSQKEAARAQPRDLGPKLPPSPIKDQPRATEPKSAEKSPRPQPRDLQPTPQATARQAAKAVEVKRQETSKQRLAEEKARLEEKPGHPSRAAEAPRREKGRDEKEARIETRHNEQQASKHGRDDEDSKHHPGRQEVTGKDDDSRARHADRETAKEARQTRAEQRKEEREARGKKEQEEKKAAEAAAAKAAADAAAAKAAADAAAAKAAADAARARAISSAKAQQSAAAASAASTQSSVPTAQQTSMLQSTSQQSSDSRYADARSADSSDASGSQSMVQSGSSLSDSASKLGGPVQDNSSDVTTKSAGLGQGGGASDRQKDRPAGKSDSASGRFGNLLPPPAESYKRSELVATNPSPRLVSEMESRGYSVVPLKGGVVRVKLPPGSLNAWDMRRDLQEQFPGVRIGLNYVYRPVPAHPPVNQHTQYDEATISAPKPLDRSKTCTGDVCYGPKLIGWQKSLATCAADLTIGVIDTRVNKADPAFRHRKLEVIDVALKNDAKNGVVPAEHWHGTSVLSLLAGAPDGRTPGLIPDADYKVANVFFTNAQGELETDTVHLTEALAELARNKVNIVNMSLVGPNDDLVHDRITEMAANGVVFVAAAGNGGPDALPGYPAAYREVIAVTAVNNAGGNYAHANRGKYIDVAAPGVGIWAALPKGEVALVSGTSFAAPFVTAVAAVAYRDTGLQEAAWGAAALDPKHTMLTQLFGKGHLEERDPVYGRGVVKAPASCRGKGWGPVVTTATPSPAPAPLRPAAMEEGQAGLQRASLQPSSAAR